MGIAFRVMPRLLFILQLYMKYLSFDLYATIIRIIFVQQLRDKPTQCNKQGYGTFKNMEHDRQCILSEQK
jgi:hypothetical protein